MVLAPFPRQWPMTAPKRWLEASTSSTENRRDVGAAAAHSVSIADTTVVDPTASAVIEPNKVAYGGVFQASRRIAIRR